MNYDTGRLKLASLVVVFSLLLVLVGSLAGAKDQDCCLYDEKPDCPERYSSLNPSKDIYSPGETVKITLSGLNDEYTMEEIEIRKVGTDREVVYTEVINAEASSDVSEWTWQWNQIGNSGEQVDTDHYFALLETYCCGIYRTDFRIQRQVKPCTCRPRRTCCMGWSTRLDTPCNRYKTGESVAFTFSNCNDCEIQFNSLAIMKSSRCCSGSETVYYREFDGGYHPGQSWSWSWDALGDDGKPADPGYYTMVIDTECCSDLKTSFRIYEPSSCSSNCCGTGLFSLFSCCSCCD